MSAAPKLDARLGSLAVAASAILFSAKAVFIKICFRMGIPPVVLMTLRMAFSLPLFAAMAFLPRLRSGAAPPPLARKDLLGIAFLGALGYYLSSLLDLTGLQFVSAGMERLILYVYPTLVVLFSAWLFGKRIDMGLLGALALSYLGIAVSFGGEARGEAGTRPYLGGFLIFGSAVCYALFLVVQGRMIRRIDPQLLTALAMLVSSAIVIGHFLIAYPLEALRQPGRIYMLAGVLAVFATVLPAWLLGHGLKAVGAGKAAVVSTVGPVSTFALAAWLLGERAGWPQVVGLGLVLGGGLKLGLEKDGPAAAKAAVPQAGDEAPVGKVNGHSHARALDRRR